MKIVANLTLIAFLIHGVTASSKAVLCVETNGRATLEHFGCECEKESHPSSEEHSDTAEHVHVGQPDACAPCVDIPLGAKDRQMLSRNTTINKPDAAPHYLRPQQIGNDSLDLRAIALHSRSPERMAQPVNCAHIPLRI